MYLICVPLFATTSGRKLLLVDVVVRVGSEFRNSRPQYHVYDPCTTNPSFPEPSLPSMMTRSPGYPRTMIGAAAEPARFVSYVPRYVPARTQIVSPACTFPPAPERAVGRSHGLVELPSPLLEPPVVT